MKVLKSAMCVALIAISTLASPARAGRLETQFEVYLDVVASCSLVSATDVAFGSQVVAPGQQLEAFGSLKVRCNVPVAYQITLDQGLHGTGVNDRRMAGPGGDTIAYQLYSGDSGTTSCNDAAGVQWGNATTGCIYGDSYAGTEQDIQIHGKLTMGNPRAGSYSDTITATITY
ncbi:Csu type fimbrial protein [Novilysobacter erysipheiresistens]|uniref:Spore coat U domain-containing protein n=1 Tax=Novilysobacter erysipheiresistens TaxID=1749332 RepID=A0ABU7YUT0_9GAMM